MGYIVSHCQFTETITLIVNEPWWSCMWLQIFLFLKKLISACNAAMNDKWIISFDDHKTDMEHSQIAGVNIITTS